MSAIKRQRASAKALVRHATRNQLAGLAVQAGYVARDIAAKWNTFAEALALGKPAATLPAVHQLEERLRAILAECKRLRAELGE